MRILQMPDAIRYPTMSTAQLRESFLLEDLFQPGTIQNVYVAAGHAIGRRKNGCVHVR